MHVRCPFCHSPVETNQDDPLTKITCISCGSDFNLVSGSETKSFHGGPKESIGHFDLLEQLGMGSFGSVWKSRDNTLDRTVAIKVPRTRQLSQGETEQFLREARAAAQLRHPNIVSVHEVGREGDVVYIVCDYVEGCTLKEWTSAQPLTFVEAAGLCATIARALDHAHNAGVIHRDLKPANILLDLQGKPHISDFGLAKRESGEITMTIQGQLLGTPAYMSPEQARGDAHHADRRTDIYSLGVILFELLTNELPFRGEPRMLVVQILRDDPPHPRKLNGKIPRDLETICLKCLEKNPDRRFQSAADMAFDLENWLAGKPIRSRPVRRVERAIRWCQQRPVVAGLMAVVVLVALVGFSAVTWQWQRAEGLAETEAHSRRELERREQELILAKNLAENARNAERVSREHAQSALRQAEAREEAAQRDLYSARILAASEAVASGELSRAWSLLVQYRQPHPERDLRTFEWRHLAYEIQPIRIGSVVSNVQRMDLASNGKTLAVSTSVSRSVVVIVDVATGKSKSSLNLSPAAITVLQFLPGSPELAIADSRGNLTIWDTELDSKETFPSVHDKAILSLGINHDGTLIASASSEELKVWPRGNVDNPTLTLSPIPSGLARVAISPDGSILATGHRASTFQPAAVRLWDVASGKLLRSLSGHVGAVIGVIFAPDGKSLTTAGMIDATIRIWDVATWRVKRILKSQLGSIYRVALSIDGERLACASDEGVVLIWNVKTGELVTRVAVNLGDRKSWRDANFSSIALSEDGLEVATLLGGQCTVWATQHIEPTILKGHVSNARCVAFAPDGAMLASGGFDGTIRIWDLKTGEELKELQADQKFVQSVDFSPDGRYLVSSGEGVVRLWDTKTWSHQPIIETAFSMHSAFSPDGSLIAIATGDSRKKIQADIVLWNCSQQKVIGSFKGHQGPVEAVLFSPDGRYLLSSANDDDARIWDVHTLREFHRLSGHSTNSLGIAFSQDGAKVATGDDAGVIRLWDVETGRLRLEFQGHPHQVYDLAFVSGDRTLVSCGWDGNLRFWDPLNGNKRASIQAHRPYVWELAYLANEDLIATCGGDGNVRIWRTVASLVPSGR